MPTKEERAAYDKIYNATPEGKANRATYRNSPKMKAFRKTYYARPQERLKARMKSRTPEARTARKAYEAEHPKATREAKWRQQKINITWEKYLAMFIEQDYKCAICRISIAPSTVQCMGNQVVGCVDHDHNTSKVRGLLCQRCNSGIGNLGDNSAVCHGAGNYLEDWKNKS